MSGDRAGMTPVERVERALDVLEASKPHLRSCSPLEFARELIVQALDMLPDEDRFYALTDALIELNDAGP